MGSFSSGGNLPLIDDSRITWHIGNVFDTIKDLDQLNADKFKTLYLFDMDLYEPTRFCIDSLKNMIKVGDIFHFDEAFDQEACRDYFALLIRNMIRFVDRNIWFEEMSVTKSFKASYGLG